MNPFTTFVQQGDINSSVWVDGRKLGLPEDSPYQWYLESEFPPCYQKEQNKGGILTKSAIFDQKGAKQGGNSDEGGEF